MRPGTQSLAINAPFFGFVKQARTTFGGRVGLEDVGIYYSSSLILENITPQGFPDMDNQAHSSGYYGWATALANLHQQDPLIWSGKNPPATR